MSTKIHTQSIDDPRFLKFIRKHHVLTLCTTKDNQPWCSACFYAYDTTENCFVFTSDENTRHVMEILTNENIAANIVLETKIIGMIQGLQITGKVVKLNDQNTSHLKGTYLKKFPFAFLVNTSLWALYPNSLKLTDNKLGFGTKLIWTNEL